MWSAGAAATANDITTAIEAIASRIDATTGNLPGILQAYPDMVITDNDVHVISRQVWVVISKILKGVITAQKANGDCAYPFFCHFGTT